MKALVLGGGGVAGIAWMTGVLAGVADSGSDVRDADLVIGTSAGATVGAQLASGLSLDELVARQVDPSLQAAELMADIDLTAYVTELFGLFTDPSDVLACRGAVGRFALDADTVPEAARRSVVESRLPSHDWPAHDLRVVAVDAVSGRHRVFDRASGVALVDAVAASCAVPGIWPPVTIEGARYVDGGVRSGSNADLAAGADEVLVLAPLGEMELFPTDAALPTAVAALRRAGARVAVVAPDEASRAAMGANPLDPATRAPAAEAGRAQGRSSAPRWE